MSERCVAEWFEDPAFDDTAEVYAGKYFHGDDWRRLQQAKEQGLREVISVAGVTFHRGNVEQVIGKHGVALIPEPDNPHDDGAIRVEVAGKHVGYIPKGRPISPQANAQVLKIGMVPQPHVWLAVGA